MFLLEGNLGAGKSTLLSLIKKHLSHIQVVQEPVNKWHNDDHNSSLLTHFYKDSMRWSYTMETHTMMTRVKEHLEEQAKNNPLKIMERSLYSGYYCFAKNGFAQGYLNEEEWFAHNEWFKFLIPNMCKPPHGFIYLQTKPEVCYERMNKRNRSGEEAVPLSYLTQIHDQHEKFLIQKKDILKQLRGVPVLILEVSEEFADNETRLDDLLKQIDNFTSEHSGLIIPKNSIAQLSL